VNCTQFLVELAESFERGGSRDYNPELANRLRTAACYTLQAEADEREIERRKRNRAAVAARSNGPRDSEKSVSRAAAARA